MLPHHTTALAHGGRVGRGTHWHDAHDRISHVHRIGACARLNRSWLRLGREYHAPKDEHKPARYGGVEGHSGWIGESGGTALIGR
jgi:hypothetical protein